MSSVRVVSVTESDNKEPFFVNYFNGIDANAASSINQNVPDFNELKFTSADLYPLVDKMAFLELLNFLDIYS